MLSKNFYKKYQNKNFKNIKTGTDRSNVDIYRFPCTKQLMKKEKKTLKMG